MKIKMLLYQKDGFGDQLGLAAVFIVGIGEERVIGMDGYGDKYCIKIIEIEGEEQQ